MEVLRVYVNLTGWLEVTSGDRVVKMLPFDGTCDGPYFKGTILQGGVDTQKTDLEGNGTLSARYMIDGVDCEGNKCRMFIENNAKTKAALESIGLTTDAAFKSLLQK